MNKQHNAQQLLQHWRLQKPQTRQQLVAYIKAFLGWRIPDRQVCAHHQSPMDYLAWALGVENDKTYPSPARQQGDVNAYLNDNCVAASSPQDLGMVEGLHHPQAALEAATRSVTQSLEVINRDRHNQDAIVWANRGGGKTQLGAVASLLECVFLPRCSVRILGGSQEQSERMYEYLRAGLEQRFGDLLAGRLSGKGCRFVNGSDVQVLAQSDSSVRGHHVQRLRCDELELFDPDVWQAAQFITHSKHDIAARLEVFSTMHRPLGLMHELIGSAAQRNMRIFHWCLWEVIETCRDRSCSRCVLWEDCRGRAKNAGGYYAIDDAIAQKRRSSRNAWQAEMLCEQPNRCRQVFAEFDPRLHVREISYDANRPLYRSLDFGFTHPLACLFIQTDDEGNVYVLDEHIKSRTTLAEHARLIQQRLPYPAAANYGDPAGRQRREITGTSVATELTALGMPLQSRPSRITEGIELIRSALAPADGKIRLFVSPKCEQLIRSFMGLQYQKLPNGADGELPEKDGVHDHVIDALRYFFVNHFGQPHNVKVLTY